MPTPYTMEAREGQEQMTPEVKGAKGRDGEGKGGNCSKTKGETS